MLEIKEICSKLEDLLKESGSEFETCWGYNKEIYGSADNNFKITVKNPHINRNMSIDIYESGEELGSHADFNFTYFNRSFNYFNEIPDMLEMVRGFLTSEMGGSEIYLGKKHKLSQLGGVYRKDVESMPPLECLYTGPHRHYGGAMPKQIKGQCLRYGAELRFIFWDPQYDRSVIIEKESKS